MASRVSAMSVTTPSVRISRMKYCWGDRDARGLPCLTPRRSSHECRECARSQPSPGPGGSGTHRRLLGPLLVGRHASHLGDDGSHVGGAVELDFGQAALVGLHDALDACGMCEG